MSESYEAGRERGAWRRKVFLIGAALVAAVPLTIVCSSEGYLAVAKASDIGSTVPSHALPTLLSGKQWLNGRRLSAADLRGKVVLVNFWTYSCINCLRALPHYREWAEKYRDHGLVVIGVHSPEFGFEHQPTNVTKAVGALDVNYPVVIDSDFTIWNAFNNNAWPAIYVFDEKGRFRQRAIGEGDYDRLERVIQQLLADASHAAPVRAGSKPVAAAGTQMAADLANLRSPETYLGFAKATGYVGANPMRPNREAAYSPPSTLPLNAWSLAGRWTVGGEYAEGTGPSSAIVYRFHARDLHLVLGTKGRGKPIRFRVTIDGAAPGASHGSDTDAGGNGVIGDTKLYQLVRQTGPVRDRSFKIEFLDPGGRAYAFTFG
jgi:thiol-disulfide isomerase/thioredoxin